MNEALTIEGIGGIEPINVQLLSEDELLSVSGGIGPLAAVALVGGGGLAVFVFAAIAGVAVYYLTH